MLVLLLAAGRGDESFGGGVRDLEDGWLADPGATAAFLRYGAEDGRGATTWFAAGTGRLFGMTELPVRAVAAGGVLGGGMWEAAWQQLGGDPYRETEMRIGFSRRCGRGLRLGARAGRLQAALAGCDGEGAIDIEVIGDLEPHPGLCLQFRLPATDPPRWWAGRVRRRWLTVRGENRLWRWAAAFDRRDRGEVQVQGELALRLGAAASAGVRADPVTGTCGWIWAVRRGRLLLRGSHLVHPDLGATHRWQCCLLAGGGS